MKKLAAYFYRSEAGAQPARDFLVGLTAEDRKIVGEDIATVEFGWPVGMPTCRPLGDGLYEVRSTIRKGKVEARVYFGISNGKAILLHGHTGKDGQDKEIKIARKRWADYVTQEKTDGTAQ
jgi:phage-related protein